MQYTITFDPFQLNTTKRKCLLLAKGKVI